VSRKRFDVVVGAGSSGGVAAARLCEDAERSVLLLIRMARPRPNFEVRGNALVERVLLAGGRATGVRCPDADGRPVEIEAGLLLLAAGAYGTPAILLRSGVGPADELGALGIELVADLPVGRGPMDHPQCLFLLGIPPVLAEIAGPGFGVVGRGDGWFSFPLGLDETDGV
jgi:choline dehydrogenase-like flavoprotein